MSVIDGSFACDVCVVNKRETRFNRHACPE